MGRLNRILTDFYKTFDTVLLRFCVLLTGATLGAALQQDMGCYGHAGLDKPADRLQFGFYSYVDMNPSSRLQTGVITSVEFRANRVARILLQVYRPEGSAGSLRLVHNLAIRPSAVGRQQVTGLRLPVQRGDHWGFSYGGNNQIPIAYDVATNSSGTPYLGRESHGSALTLLIGDTITFTAGTVQKKFQLLVCMGPVTTPGPQTTPIQTAKAPPMGALLIGILAGGGLLLVAMVIGIVLILWKRRRPIVSDRHSSGDNYDTVQPDKNKFASTTAEPPPEAEVPGASGTDVHFNAFYEQVELSQHVPTFRPELSERVPPPIPPKPASSRSQPVPQNLFPPTSQPPPVSRRPQITRPPPLLPPKANKLNFQDYDIAHLKPPNGS